MYTKYAVIDYYDGYDDRWFFDCDRDSVFDNLQDAITRREFLIETDDYNPANLHIQEVKYIDPHVRKDINEFL